MKIFKKLQGHLYFWLLLSLVLFILAWHDAFASGVGSSVGGVPQTLNVKTIRANATEYTGAAPRIRGDFSTATLENRLAFQSSVVNGSTQVTTIPNGTSAISGYHAYDASDPNNAALMQMIFDGTVFRFVSTKNGTGVAKPISFWTDGTPRVRIENNGNVLINTAVDCGAKLCVEGNVITSSDGGLMGANDNARMVYAKINGGGTLIAQRPNAVPWVSSTSRFSAGVYDITVLSGQSIALGASAVPSCTATLHSLVGFITTSSLSSLNLRIQTFNSAGTPTDANFAVICVRE